MSALTLTKDNFMKEAINAKETVLIDFWAEWCGPCRMISPIVDEIAREGRPGIKVCKVNVDEQAELARQFRVMSIPTLIVMKNGKVVATSVGVKPKQTILSMVQGA